MSANNYQKGGRPRQILITAIFLAVSAWAPAAFAVTSSGSTGLSGTVSAPPPKQAPTINIPRNGDNFSTIPITVSGLCPASTLVEVYKNNVFSGSANCTNGSYNLQIDLFNGRNDLIARAYDNLNQASPDSATVTVNFSSPVSTGTSQLILTTQFAKRGADPGAILTWPITVSGGRGPYAISVDWGDKSNPDLISQAIPGNFTLQHTYAQSGIYKVTMKVTDADGSPAFLQLVAIANGPIAQQGGSTSGSSLLTVQTKVMLWPIIVLFVLMIAAFWVGRKQQLEAIKNRLSKGEPPF
jgi:hypothetical protein